MTDLTKHRSSYNPWIIGFPFLPATPATGTRPPRPPTPSSPWLARLRCRLHRGAIDRELASGVDPTSSECRHRRACALTEPDVRRELAAAYERLLMESEQPSAFRVVRVNWRGVRAAAPRLSRLVQRLRDDPSVSAQGAAQARLLLTDAGSSLYARTDQLRLVHEVRSTLALL